jgi:hypothetical protein
MQFELKKGMIMLIRVSILSAAMLLSMMTVVAPPEAATRAVSFRQRGLLSDDKVVAGLKEALQVGTGNAVNLTGKVDGYFRNLAIKILMPKQLQTMEKGLRAIGYGPQVDEFILSMNRAAERAAPQARKIFVEAIREMTFTDARKILTGGETAATEYFTQ